MIGLLELLRARGFTPQTNEAKLIRHKGDNLNMEVLLRDGWFETYQSFQSKQVFEGCTHIVSFVGEESVLSRFVGVYSVDQSVPASPELLPQGCPYLDWAAPGHFHYTLTKCLGFEDLEHRVVIDWGKGAQAWHQWLSDKPIVEIRAPGRALPPFRDFLRVHLSFNELVNLVRQASAHRDWVSALSAVGGIYLVVDSLTGAQYVGSATGSGGIWQRWCDYAASGHGDNLRLRQLCSDDPKRAGRFQFSVLETLSRSVGRDEAIRLEGFFKQKLGTRAFGLNDN
jgi:hypothetical protein